MTDSSGFGSLFALAEGDYEALAREYRREMWINHGHDFAALYGDDGEMQCGACPLDFRRAPLEQVRQAVWVARNERIRKLMEHPS